MNIFYTLYFLFGSLILSVDDVNDPQIISRYNDTEQTLSLKLTLDTDAQISFQLFDQDATIVKAWSPQQADEGVYQTQLPMKEVSKGTYMLNIEINKAAYQQVVWIY